MTGGYLRQKRAVLTLLAASIVLAAPLLFGFLRSSAATANDSLLAYFKFEESLVSDVKVDYSGDNHTGSPSGTVLPPYSGNTPPTNYGNGQSLTFGNTNNAVNITSTAALDDLTNLSASAWIYPTSYAGESAQGRIIDKTNSVNGWSFYVDNGALHFYANFSTSALNRVTLATLPTDTWAHVAVSWDGTANSSGVKLYIDGVEQTTFSTDTSGVGSRIADTSYNIIIGNNSALNRSFAGQIDEVRLYNRMFLDSEVADMAAGDHPTATWTGATSIDYETATNWDTGAIPDPYAHVRVSPATNQPVTSTNIALGELTIDAGARLNVLAHNVNMNDGGDFNNNGTLQLRNSQTFTGFTNDTDSGTVLLTPVSDTTGLKTGNSYYNLILNDSTFAHWPLDEAAGTTANDVSGFERHADYADEPLPSTDRPDTNYANDNSLEFDGIDDALTFDDETIPDNATWCAWANMTAGDGVILGANTPGQYALAVYGGTEVRAYEQAGSQQASWTVDSVYGGWKHFCITQTDLGATHALALYIDGESQGGSETLLNGAGAINRIGTDSVDYFEGLIDDVRIYSRVLTGGEINAMVAGNMPETTLYRTSLGAAVDINGDLIINSGIFDSTVTNHGINIAGDLDNNGGRFQGRSSTITLDGGDQRIKSSTTFYNLTKNVATAATLTFGEGSMTTVTNQLTLNGAAGQLLSLRSSEDGDQWFLDPSGTESISYLDVMDSHNIDPYPVDITNANVTDSGNNTNWTINVAPNAPTNLGGASYVGGGFVGDSTPTLTFDLSDTNPADLVRYQIQIDDDSDFSSPTVDYTSAEDSQGSRSFTVGQNDTGDTYNVGSDGMTLPTGDYYWRVKTIDNYTSPNESAYTTANSGSVAFQLDVTPPTDPGVPTTASGQTNKTPTWTWSASTDSESGLGSPTYTLQWSTDNTFNSGVSSNTTDNTSFTHGSNLTDGYWYFRVRATDAMGNNSSWAMSAAHLIDTTGPTTPVAPYTSSPTNFNQPTWSWSAPTDAGAGLAATPYLIQYSQVSNFSSGVTDDTSDVNNYPHPTVLTDGTWYFRVRAVDALGNLSAWSAGSSVLIDTTPPSLPGQPYTDTPTNDDTPSWTWDPSIDAGVGLTPTPYTVQWSQFSDFSNIGGSTTSATNSYTHGGSLADGTWYIRINARDTLSNQSAYSTSGVVTIDTVAPDTPDTPTTTSPTNDDTPTWTWPVPDDTGVGLADTPYEIEWSSASDFSVIEDSATSDTNSFTHTDPLPEGVWYIRVRATDAADNTSSFSAGGEVDIDTTAPTIPGDPSTADPINDDTPTWTWTVSTDSGVGLATDAYELEWSEDNTFSSGVESDTSTTNSFTHTDGLVDGTWYFRVRAVDAVGNRSAWTNAGSKVVDINPPTVPGTPTTTDPSADNTPTWTWNASTDAGMGLDELPYMIEWSQDNTFNVGVESDTIADATFTHTDPLADGMWYFRVRAADDVGNISAYSPTGEVFVDASAPSTPGTPSTTSPTNDDTPTWSWSASSDGSGTGLDDDAYIVEWSTVSDLSSAVQSSTSTTNSFSHSTGLADGTWYFRVRAVDVVGNTSADSAIASVIVDDTAPSVPGQANTPTPTNDDTPTWTWSASTDNGVGLRNPAYDISWSQDEDFLSGVITDTVNTNTFTHTDPLADGTWYFRVRAVDALDNTSSYAASGSVLLSTAGPTIPGQPAADENPTTDTTPTWTWTASTADAGLADPAYHIEWSQDNTFLSGVTTGTVNTNTFTHTDPLADGTWYFRLRAEDNTNTFSLYSLTGSVLIDTTAPTIPGSVTTPSPTSDTTPTWTWDPSTDGGAGLEDPAYYIEWSTASDFNSVEASATSNTATFTHTDPLADGTWYIRIRAEDVLANQSAYSTTATVVIDATAPTTPGTPDTTTPTNDTTPTWTWDPSSDSGVGLGDPAYEVQWSQSSSFSSGISSATTNNTNFTHSLTLADGTWYFRVRAEDDIANISNWSANGEVTVDSGVPTVPGTPDTGMPATNDTTPTWTWDPSSDSGVGLGDPAYEVQWSQDSDFLSGVSSNTASGATFTHGSDIPEGTWYFRVRAVDDVGNQSGWSGNGEVYVDTDAPSAPGTPSTDSSPTSDTTPTWTWDPSADNGFGFGPEPYQLEWSQDSNFITDVQSGSHDSETFTHTDPLADGTWYFRVQAEDDAGNASAWSAYGTIVIDATAPTLPANVATDTPTKDATPTWTWDASSDSGVGLDDPAYEIQWTEDETFSSGVSSDTTNDPTFTHVTELDFGEWYFRVRAVDAIGNASAWVVGEVSIDNTPPVLSSITATPGSAGAVITWTTNEIASSRVIYSAGPGLSETTPETNTSPRVTSHTVIVQNLPACSTIQFQVASIDQLDNEAISGTGTFTTTACSGNAAVMTQSRSTVGTSGGQASLNAGSAAALLQIPASAVTEDTDFQIKQLSPAAALAGIGQPSGYSLVGSHLYDLKALTSDTTVVSNFDGTLTVTMTYTAAEASGFTPSSFLIFRHDGSTWQQLGNCQVNTGTQQVSCQTTAFSVFGLFGVRTVPAPPLPEGDGIVEPDPLPETKPLPEQTADEEQPGQTETASDQRGLSAAVTRAFRTVVSRPVWWASILLLIGSAGTLFYLKKIRPSRGNHKPYGIHKDE